jgi:hypothetical protein
MWCNASVTSKSLAEPTYDGYEFYYWYPENSFTIWFDSPIIEEELENGDICFRIQGNIWLCPRSPQEQMPEAPAAEIPSPYAVTAGNIKPMISVTSVKMENHPEHIAVMFGQVLNNLK